MFKPAHRVDGFLLTALTADANTLKLDSAAMAVLEQAIGTDGTDHTYLLISGASTAKEVVKVTSIQDGVAVIERGQDGTSGLPFPATARVSYILSAGAIQDLMDAHAGMAVTITAGNQKTLVEKVGTNNYTISALVPDIYSSSYNVLSVQGGVGTDPYYLSINTGALGCCSDTY